MLAVSTRSHRTSKHRPISFVVLKGCTLEDECPAGTASAAVAVAGADAYVVVAQARQALLRQRLATLAGRGVRMLLCTEKVRAAWGSCQKWPAKMAYTRPPTTHRRFHAVYRAASPRTANLRQEA